MTIIPESVDTPRERLRITEPNPELPPATLDPELPSVQVLESLPQAIQPLFQFYGEKFKKLLQRKKELLTKKQKLEDKELIPNSIRFQFTIGASDAVKDEYKDDITTAEMECQVALERYQKDVI